MIVTAENQEVVLLSSPKLEVIPTEIFEAFPNMTAFAIDKSRLDVIDQSSFENCTENLKVLKITNNNLRSLAENVFAALENLEYLNLSGNMLSDIDKNAFDGLENLKILDLTINKLSKIHEETFNGLTNLEQIYLDSNEFKILDKNLFSGNHMLYTVSMRFNQIFAISIAFFDENSSLKQVNFRSNDCVNFDYQNFQDHVDTLDEDLEECFSNYKDVKYFDEDIETKLHFLKEVHSYFVDMLEDDISELESKNENQSNAIVFLSNFQVFACFMIFGVTMYTTFMYCMLNKQIARLNEIAFNRNHS